ncbi:MAG TPA: M48 family metalloprotease [Burkholderiales bacterium]|nr:M48 family metalloprotease [Burkholderiales bacterium]
MILLISELAACSLMAAGCATSQISGREQFAGLPFGVQAAHADFKFALTTSRRLESTETAPSVGASNAVDQLNAFIAQVRRVVRRLQVAAPTVYPHLVAGPPSKSSSSRVDVFEVFVVDSSSPGTASSASRKIAINAALGRIEASDDVVAFIVAREMGHVIARHSEESSAASLATSVLMNLVIPGGGLLKMVVSFAGSQLAADSKREEKRQEADAIALALLKEAGYERSELMRGLTAPLHVAALSGQGEENSWAADLRSSAAWLLANPRGGSTWIANPAQAAVQGAAVQTKIPTTGNSEIWALQSISTDSLAAINTQNRQALQPNDSETNSQAIVPQVSGLPAPLLEGGFIPAIRIR